MGNKFVFSLPALRDPVAFLYFLHPLLPLTSSYSFSTAPNGLLASPLLLIDVRLPKDHIPSSSKNISRYLGYSVDTKLLVAISFLILSSRCAWLFIVASKLRSVLWTVIIWTCSFVMSFINMSRCSLWLIFAVGDIDVDEKVRRYRHSGAINGIGRYGGWREVLFIGDFEEYGNVDRRTGRVRRSEDIIILRRHMKARSRSKLDHEGCGEDFGLWPAQYAIYKE